MIAFTLTEPSFPWALWFAHSFSTHTAAAAVSQLFINSLLYYANRTLLVSQDLLLFIVRVGAWSTFNRAQMFPFEERDAGFAA